MKRPLQHFDIPIKGLQDGLHEIELEVGDAFFGHFEGSIIDNGQFTIKLYLTKKPDHSELLFDVQGTTQQTCDRCLEPVVIEVSGSYTMYLKQGEVEEVVDEDLIYVAATAPSFNVGKPIYEIITVLMPLRKVHPEVDGESCIEETLDQIESKESEITSDDNVWSSLKDLKFE